MNLGILHSSGCDCIPLLSNGDIFNYNQAFNLLQAPSQSTFLPVYDAVLCVQHFNIFPVVYSYNRLIIIMAEVPRKPTFPDHVVRKLLHKIQQEVQDNVIPVSAGIYSEQKLVAQLQAIPKPVLADYDDRVFYEAIEKQGICQLSACPTCHQEFNNRKKAVMCHFCSRWSCDQCICHRQRLHPLDNNPNGKRFSICYDCDGKYLTLQLGHPYVQNRVLIETAIVAVSAELEDVQQRLQTQKRKIDAVKGEPKRKLNMRVSILKKQDLDIRKNIKKLSWDIEAEKDKMSKLQQKVHQAKAKYQRELEIRAQRQRHKAEEKRAQEERRLLEERKKAEEEQLQIEMEKQQERLRKEKQEAEKMQRQQQEKEKERLRILEMEMQKEKQKERKKQKERQLQLQKEKERMRLKELQRKRELQRIKEEERLRQLRKQKELEERLQMQKQEQERRLKQIEELKAKEKERQKIQALRIEQQNRLKQEAQSQNSRSKKQKQRLDNQQNEIISCTFEPSTNEPTRDTENEATLQNENSNRNSYLYNQFKNYFTQDILSNAQSEQSAAALKLQQHEGTLSHKQKEQMFSMFRRSLEEQQVKAAESPDVQNVKMEIMREANKKRRNWEDLNQEEDEQQVVGVSQKCKCVVF